MTARAGLVAAALVTVVLVLGGAGWDRHDGVVLDDPATAACEAVRTHERARGAAVRQRAQDDAVAAARRSEVDDLRRAAGVGYGSVAQWCRSEG